MCTIGRLGNRTDRAADREDSSAATNLWATTAPCLCAVSEQAPWIKLVWSRCRPEMTHSLKGEQQQSKHVLSRQLILFACSELRF
jgi:hypothetical protein